MHAYRMVLRVRKDPCNTVHIMFASHAPLVSVDNTVYRRGSFAAMPPFLLGRYEWDNWMVGHAASNHWTVVSGWNAHERAHVDQRLEFFTIHLDHPRVHHQTFTRRLTVPPPPGMLLPRASEAATAVVSESESLPTKNESDAAYNYRLSRERLTFTSEPHRKRLVGLDTQRLLVMPCPEVSRTAASARGCIYSRLK